MDNGYVEELASLKEELDFKLDSEIDIMTKTGLSYLEYCEMYSNHIKDLQDFKKESAERLDAAIRESMKDLKDSKFGFEYCKKRSSKLVKLKKYLGSRVAKEIDNIEKGHGDPDKFSKDMQRILAEFNNTGDSEV